MPDRPLDKLKARRDLLGLGRLQNRGEVFVHAGLPFSCASQNLGPYPFGVITATIASSVSLARKASFAWSSPYLWDTMCSTGYGVMVCIASRQRMNDSGSAPETPVTRRPFCTM